MFLVLGFRVDRGGVIKARSDKKSKDKCKARLKALTNRSRGQSLDNFKKKLAKFVRGWVSYFRETDMVVFMKETDKWLRRRIRQIY